MGVLAPNPYVTDEVQKEFEENIMAKTLAGIQAEGYDFKGIIFFGLMITKKGTYLLEYNVRMGDPETQSVLYLMESDLLEIIEAAMNEELANIEVKWNKGTCVNVVLASKGYPGEFVKGYEIKINEEVKDKVFLAGAKVEDGVLKTNGGRVLSVLGVGDSVEEAREDAYMSVEGVEFEGKYFRNDIGLLQDEVNIFIGKNVFINSGCRFQDQGGTKIGDGVLIGHNVVLDTVNHDTNPSKRSDIKLVPIVISNNVWIDANVTVVPGVTICDGAIIAAGAVVTKYVPANIVVGGVPAKISRFFKDDSEKSGLYEAIIVFIAFIAAL